MKVKDLFSTSHNPFTNQFSFHLKIKESRKLGLTPSQISQMTLTKSKKIYK